MDWAIDMMDLAQEPILESAQEYQDNDFFLDMSGVSDPNPPTTHHGIYF